MSMHTFREITNESPHSFTATRIHPAQIVGDTIEVLDVLAELRIVLMDIEGEQ